MRYEIALRRVVVVAQGRSDATAALGVKKLFVLAASGRSVVLGAALVAAYFTMVPPTPEGTTQIATPCVTWMREKPDPAVHAMRHATLQLGIGLQD